MKLDVIRTRMEKDRLEGKSLEVIGKPYGVSKAIVRLILRGWKPGPKIAKILGVTVYAPAPVCEKCGVVHVTSRCVVGKTKRVKWVRVMGHKGWEAS